MTTEPPVAWNVFCGGKYIGKVHERVAGQDTKKMSTLGAALYHFGDEIGERDFSVSRT